MNYLTLLGVGLVVAVDAGSYGGPQTSLEDIERDYITNDKISSYRSHLKGGNSGVASPSKFGFVPHRTASSYAATRPKFQYSQTNYQVKKAAAKLPKYQQQYHQQTGPSHQQQYLSQQPALEYTYVQPDTHQYQQPSQQYEQYENVQYVADNALAQPEQKQGLVQPQYYYVQQYQAPSTAVESVVDPKGIQYVSFVPNSIPGDQKQYSEDPEPLVPSKRKYAQKHVEFRAPTRGHQEEPLFKREPKSLLDSYVPSVVQLRYLKQQGKKYSKY